MKQVQFVAAGSAAVEALTAAIAAAQAGDAMAPVTVVVPSNYAGLSLRRALGSRGGLLNVRFMVLARLAEMLGASTLASSGRLPLTPALRVEFIRGALAARPGVFAAVAGHGATEAALETTFHDLREVPSAELGAIAAGSARAASVVALFREFRARSDAFYDDVDLAMAGAAAVRAGSPALRDVGRVVLYQARRPGAAERDFLSALDERDLLHVLLALTGDEAGDRPVAALARELGAGLPGLAGARSPLPARLVAAPDLEEEVRTAVRGVLERLAGGMPAGRIAILFRGTQPYARIAHEQLAAAGLPASGPGIEALSGTVAGRALLGLLALPEAAFRRDLVMEWLTSAPLLGADGRWVPAARWDAISRAAGVVKGEGQWRERLARHMDTLEAERAEMEKRGETGRVQGIEREKAMVQPLLEFMEELFARLEHPPEPTWAAYSAWARDTLFRRYLGAPAERERWAGRGTGGAPESTAARAARESAEASDAIEEQLVALAALDQAGHGPTPQSFRRTLDSLLARAGARAGAVGNGVFVGPLSMAAGMDFDAVFVLGLAAGMLPPRLREDPLLPDAERRAGGPAVPLRLDRGDEERRAYLLALAAAPERVVSFARSSQRDQRKQLPSPWFREAATALAGREISTSAIETLPASAWFRPVASFEDGLRGPAPLSLREYELRELAASGAPADHPFLAEAPALARGLAAEHARMGNALTEWDGLVGARAGLSLDGRRTFSPTSLEHYASCGMRYFLGQVLRVSQIPKPESVLELSALERGTIVHHILEDFFREHAGALGPDDPWTPELRERAARVAQAHFAAGQAKGVAGKPLTWQLHRERILRELDGALTGDEARRRQHRLRYEASELEFPADPSRPVAVTLAGGRTVAFRGKIDRVDRDEDGRLWVADYKSGGAAAYKTIREEGDPVDGGKRLQLPVYAAAARQTYGEDLPVRAEYIFVKEGETSPPVGYDVTPERWQRFTAVLGRMVDGIAAGSFPADPGGPGWQSIGNNCTYCAYDAVCPASRLRDWERTANSAGAQPFLAARSAE